MNEFRRPLHDEPAAVAVREDAALHVTRCFDDEVAIDFPSIQRIVDRMRAGLLGSERERVVRRASITLTRREALTGTTVLLELPVRCTCRACGGRGESWTEACDHCRGSGEQSMLHRFTVSVPPGVADGTRFRLLVAPPQEAPTRVEVTVVVS
ncbi:MAG TPA: hypothetical protein VNK41_09755 [Vicinamibacterales bacterium]|nr:hypothetical protein [Vicinamibacterales bacterium]